MKKMTFFAAAVAATALAAAPALAQDQMQTRAGAHAKNHASKQMRHHASKGMRHQARAYRNDDMAYRDNWRNRDTGFWPADVVGTAVGTAGAIVTAPFGGQAYYGRQAMSDPNGRAYGNGYRYGSSYASADYGAAGYDDGYSYNGVPIAGSASFDARNGFTCRPGTVTRLENGERTICQ